MHTSPQNSEWNGLKMPQRIWAIIALAFGVGLAVIDGSIANVALPTMAREFGISEGVSILIINAYQIATIITILSLSALGDIFGYRRIYVGGLILFTVASIGCALSSGIEMMITMRVMQGFGAAAITSVNTSLIRAIYPRIRLAQGMGINSTVVAVSSVIGPTIAGAILSVTTWQWLFAINIPLGVIAILLSRKFLPDNPVKSSAQRFDWRDGVLCGVTFGLLMCVIEGITHKADLWLTISGAVATLTVGYIFIRKQLRIEFPILPFDLLRIPIFSLSVITSICSFIAQMLTIISLPFLLQQTYGYSEAQTGLMITAWPATIMVVAPIAGTLVRRFHAGLMGGVGLIIVAMGIFSLTTLPMEHTPIDLTWRLVICGLGFGMFQSPNNSIIIASAPQSRSGSASGMMAMARLLGQITGAALLSLLFYTFSSQATQVALYISSATAVAAAILSLTRLSLPLPEGLQRSK